jgi:hypothetical protein
VVVQESLEARHYVRFGYVDGITLSHAGRAMTHQAGKCELVHASLGAAGAECVTPAVEHEGSQTSIADYLLVRVLNRGQIPRLAGAGKNVPRDPFTYLHPSGS